MVERNIKLCCSEMTKISLISFPSSCINFLKFNSQNAQPCSAQSNNPKSQFKNLCELEKIYKYSLEPTFKNPKFESMNQLGKLCTNLSFTVENKMSNHTLIIQTKTVLLSDPALFYEDYTKLYFDAKHLNDSLWSWRNLWSPFFKKKWDAPFHNSNKQPQLYKTEAATKNFSSIQLCCNHD